MSWKTKLEDMGEMGLMPQLDILKSKEIKTLNFYFSWKWIENLRRNMIDKTLAVISFAMLAALAVVLTLLLDVIL